MKRRLLVTDGQPALGLIEEAFMLLRQLRWSSWLWYLSGTLPFLVAALYVWSDLSTSPFARDHVVESAALMLVLFLVAKSAQIRLADQLGSLARGLPPQGWTFRRCLAAGTLTVGLQPFGLFLIPIAAVLTLPAGWVVPFFQSLTVLAASPDSTPRQSLARAWRLTLLWPVQNHALLGLLSLFALVVFFNLLALSFAVPQLLKMLTGMESALTRSPWSSLNSTLLASVFGLTLLLLDPLAKAVYVLRSLYGESTRNGEDLLVALRAFQRGRTLCLAGWLFFGASLAAVAAGQSAPPEAVRQINPQQLDQAIQSTLAQREYVWRLPRDFEGAPARDPKQEGFWAQFWAGLERGMKRFGEAIRGLADRIEAAIKKFLGSPPAAPAGSRVTMDWLSPFRLLAWGAVLGLILVLGVLGWRVWLRRTRSAIVPVSGVAEPAAVDLTDERVQAGQLPQEGWLALAQELVARGELRLAMRAFHFAGLAHLAHRNLISLAAFKSNRDYVRDLQRKAHALPMLHQALAEQVESFERVWYGNYPVDPQLLEGFAQRSETLRGASS
jgi:hypothetical protein